MSSSLRASVSTPVRERQAKDPRSAESKLTDEKQTGHTGANIHAPGASRDPPALLQALKLAPAGVLGLALHIVVIVVFAARADEERGRQQGGRGGSDLLDLGDRVRQRGGVVEDVLVEAVALVSGNPETRAPIEPIAMCSGVQGRR